MMKRMINDAVLDDVRSLVEQLTGLIDLKEGELYTLRRGLLQPIRQRDEADTLRRIRILEEAYDAAYALARALRQSMRGYRPDPALVVSALVMHAAQKPDAQAIVQQYLQTLFGKTAATSSALNDARADTAF